MFYKDCPLKGLTNKRGFKNNILALFNMEKTLTLETYR
jgi:hypothetical protein